MSSKTSYCMSGLMLIFICTLLPYPSEASSAVGFGSVCQNQSCQYSGARENTTVHMSCASGSMQVRNAIYMTTRNQTSCLSYVAQTCNDKTSCSLSFNNRNCKIDPDYGVVKDGTALIVCKSASPIPSKIYGPSVSKRTGCGRPVVDKSEWTMTCANSTLEHTFIFPTSGRYAFTVTAYGQATPQLELGIDGIYPASRSVHVEWTAMKEPFSRYIFLANVSAGTHEVQMRLPEAARGQTLTIGSLSIEKPEEPVSLPVPPNQHYSTVPLTWYPASGPNAQMPTPIVGPLPSIVRPAQPTLQHGLGYDALGGSAVRWRTSGYSETRVAFPHTGYFIFDAWAYANLFGRPARLQIAINGDPCGTFDVITSTPRQFRCAKLVSAGIHLVEVLFLNDFALPNQGDKNLVINSLDITAAGWDGKQAYMINNGVGGENGVGQYTHGPESIGSLKDLKGRIYGVANDVRWYYSQSDSVFANTARRYYMYIPPGLDVTQPSPFMIFQDGHGFFRDTETFRAPIVFEKLIEQGAIPPMILIGLNPPPQASPASGCAPTDALCERSFEYDSMNDRYFQFLDREFLPWLSAKYGLNLSKDPEQRGIGGHSSGGVAAFIVGWFHPESFRKIYTSSASFTNVLNRGAHQFPDIIRNTANPPPLRVFLSAGTHDLDCWGLVGQNCAGNPHHWADGNKRVAAALIAKPFFPFQFLYGTDNHSGTMASVAFPKALRWLWSTK